MAETVSAAHEVLEQVVPVSSEVGSMALGDIADFVNGVAFKPDDWSDNGRSIIRIQNLNDSAKPFNRTERSVADKHIAYAGDLLVSWSASLGVYEWRGETACINQHIFKVIPDLKLVNKSYLKWALKSSLQSMERQVHGATMKHITRGRFLATRIPVPALAEQRRIAAILDKADALRAKRREAIAKLDQLLQSVFLEMFGDPIKNPMGWEKAAMGKLMRIRRGGSPRPISDFLGGTHHWVKIGDATKGDDIYITDTKQKITEDGLGKTVHLEPGSLIFANCGVSLGFARILSIEGCIHDGWLAFDDINENRLRKIFLLKALNGVTRYFRETAPSGTQPNLNTGIMKRFPIIVPPVELQERFERIVESINMQRLELAKALRRQEELFASIQQKSFNVD